MQSHRDQDYERAANRDEFLSALRAKAEKMLAAGESKITGGEDGEPVLNEWKKRGVSVRELPADPLGILRISVGGGDDTPVPLSYLVFRGNHSKCVDLLRNALIALQEGPEA